MLQVAIAFDQLLNTILGGWADETLSARTWRNRNNSWYWHSARVTIDTIFFWQKNHCYESYLSEMKRTQLPKEYRI